MVQEFQALWLKPHLHWALWKYGKVGGAVCAHSLEILEMSAQIREFSQFLSLQSSMIEQGSWVIGRSSGCGWWVQLSWLQWRGRLSLPSPPKIAIFRCMASVFIIFHGSAYISFKNRVNLWSWSHVDMITVFRVESFWENNVLAISTISSLQNLEASLFYVFFMFVWFWATPKGA